MLRRSTLGICGCRGSLWGLVCVGASLALATGFEREAAGQTVAKADQPPVVYTTFYPTTYFTQRIAGDQVKVVCPCPADADPAAWMPDDQTIEAYQQADLIVINGASFEKWVAKATLPQSRIVDTARPFEDKLIELERGVTHKHGPAGKHEHRGIDGHTWVDPANAKMQAAEIKKALIKKSPAHKDAFAKGYAALIKDLDALDARLRAVSAKIGDQTLLCSHPAYNYVARHYGWHVKVFYLEPEEATDEKELDLVRAFLEDHPAKYLLWETQPTKEIAEKMSAQFGLESIVYSPCETLDSEALKAGEDFLSVMNGNVDRLEAVFEPRPSAEKP